MVWYQNIWLLKALPLTLRVRLAHIFPSGVILPNIVALSQNMLAYRGSIKICHFAKIGRSRSNGVSVQQVSK